MPPIVAKDSAIIERQMRFADKELEGGTEPARFPSKARVSVAERRRAKIAVGAERQRTALGNAERMKAAHLGYETVHGLPIDSSTAAQIERSSAGVAGSAEPASVIESYDGQTLVGF